MEFGVLLVLLGIGFYAFIGTAPKEAVQIFLMLAWAAMLLPTVWFLLEITFKAIFR